MPDLVKPPAVASAILNFFSHQPDFPALAGDMAEEFEQRARVTGATAAKRWYWRETFRNGWALTAREILRTPARTAMNAFGCVLAVNIVTALYIITKNYPDPFQYSKLMHLLLNRPQRDVILLIQFIAPLATGWIGGRLLPGREWALALMYTLLTACLALPACYLLLVGKVNVPKPLQEFVLIEIALRLSGFWLGALWIRRSRIIVTGGPAPHLAE